MLEVKASKAYKTELKTETIKTIIILSFLLVVTPAILMKKYWYIGSVIGMILIPIWIKLRWKTYLNELSEVNNHKLTINNKTMVFQYKNSHISFNLKNLNALNVNLKNDAIVSIKLLFSDKNDFSLTKYDKMDNILKHLKTIVGNQNITYHRWFHKN